MLSADPATLTPAPSSSEWSVDDDQDEEESVVALGLYKLQEWLLELYRRKIAYQDDDGVICVYPEVAERFALGVKEDCAFVVMPPLETEWAKVLVWSHAAMREGKPTLFLVAEPVEIGGVDTPPFGMSFTIATEHLAKALEQHATLELRRFVKSQERWGVSQEAFTSMPLVIVQEDDNVFEVGQKKKLKSSKSAGGRR